MIEMIKSLLKHVPKNQVDKSIHRLIYAPPGLSQLAALGLFNIVSSCLK